MNDDERMLEQGTRRLLDRAARDLNERTLERLRHARAQAWRRAEATHRGQAPRRAARWLPAGGAAVAGLALAIAVVLWPTRPQPVPALAADDLELLVAGEGPDFYAELEFYQWVAAHDAG